MPNDFEIGVTLTPGRHDSLDGLASVAQDAERLGFDTVGFGETTGWDSIALLTVLAERTETIRIADDVIGPFSRSPSQIAQAAASIQSLAGADSGSDSGRVHQRSSRGGMASLSNDHCVGSARQSIS